MFACFFVLTDMPPHSAWSILEVVYNIIMQGTLGETDTHFTSEEWKA